MSCGSQHSHRRSLGDLPVTMTFLMWAAASSRSTGFVSCFRRFSITRRPRNSSPDSASSLGARTETHMLFPMDSTESKTLPAIFVQWKSHARWETQLLQVQHKKCSTSIKITAASAKLLICSIAISRKECSRDVCAERGTEICRNYASSRNPQIMAYRISVAVPIHCCTEAQ